MRNSIGTNRAVRARDRAGAAAVVSVAHGTVRSMTPPHPDESAPAAPQAPDHLRAITEVSTNDLVDGYWITRSADEGLTARELYSWMHEDETADGDRVLDTLADEGEILSTARYRRSGKTEVLLRLDGTLANVMFLPSGSMWVAVAAKSTREAKSAVDRLLALFPEKVMDKDAAPNIPLSVWTHGSSEPTRRITQVGAWSDIAANYAASTREHLAALMEPGFEAGKGGKLLLLHGAPGTGKSTALATLAWQWKEWGELHYIADPAAFLSEPDYLIHVSLGRRRDENWRVVLLEDAGGLFAPDAKQSAGEDRLGRLLNMTDGMLGNTSKALFIITTNEPLTTFHTAVSRPGRCAATVEFVPFTEAEAKAWLEAKERADLAAGVVGERTLAELYGMLNGTVRESSPKQRVGFRTAD